MIIDEATRLRCGLAKSAFRDTIYRGLPLDAYLPDINFTSRLVRAAHRAMPKFYQSHDAYLMFHQPYDAVAASLKRGNKAAPAWHEVIRATVSKDEFYELNKLTANSPELSAIAAAKLLGRLLRSDIELLNKSMQQGTVIIDALRGAVERAEDGLKDALAAVSEFREAREAAEAAASLLVGSGGSGFTKEALSAWRFLQDPDDFRKRVRLLRFARAFFSKFVTAVPVSMQHQQTASLYGGVDGVERMVAERQLPDVLPSELALTQLGSAGRALLALKIAQRQLMVYQRAATILPVVFVDKSGSMAEDLRWSGGEKVPKISLAAGLALALYHRLGADIYLFDTECDRVSPAKVVETLMTIEADGGTDIDPVLSEILRIGKKDYIYIIVSDGITEASDETLKAFRDSGLAARTKLILIPPASEQYNWVGLLQQHGNVHYARDVAQFEEAAKRVLR